MKCRALSAALFVALACACLVGCGHGVAAQLPDAWIHRTDVAYAGQPVGSISTLVVRPDGTLTYRRRDPGGPRITQQGHWSLDGDGSAFGYFADSSMGFRLERDGDTLVTETGIRAVWQKRFLGIDWPVP